MKLEDALNLVKRHARDLRDGALYDARVTGPLAEALETVLAAIEKAEGLQRALEPFAETLIPDRLWAAAGGDPILYACLCAHRAGHMSYVAALETAALATGARYRRITKELYQARLHQPIFVSLEPAEAAKPQPTVGDSEQDAGDEILGLQGALADHERMLNETEAEREAAIKNSIRLQGILDLYRAARAVNGLCGRKWNMSAHADAEDALHAAGEPGSTQWHLKKAAEAAKED